MQLIGADKVSLFPSFVFALETALLDLWNGGERIIFKNPVSGRSTDSYQRPYLDGWTGFYASAD
jgi:hypothetical protein